MLFIQYIYIYIYIYYVCRYKCWQLKWQDWEQEDRCRKISQVHINSYTKFSKCQQHKFKLSKQTATKIYWHNTLSTLDDINEIEPSSYTLTQCKTYSAIVFCERMLYDDEWGVRLVYSDWKNQASSRSYPYLPTHHSLVESNPKTTELSYESRYSHEDATFQSCPILHIPEPFEQKYCHYRPC